MRIRSFCGSGFLEDLVLSVDPVLFADPVVSWFRSFRGGGPFCGFGPFCVNCHFCEPGSLCGSGPFRLSFFADLVLCLIPSLSQIRLFLADSVLFADLIRFGNVPNF